MITSIKTQITNNKFKLKRQNVEDLKNIINGDIYHELVSEMLTDFISHHKFFKLNSLDILLELEKN